MNIAFNYGFKMKLKVLLIKLITKFKINVDSDKELRKLFYLGSFPDPDILIELWYQRLSNFIMYN